MTEPYSHGLEHSVSREEEGRGDNKVLIIEKERLISGKYYLKQSWAIV